MTMIRSCGLLAVLMLSLTAAQNAQPDMMNNAFQGLGIKFKNDFGQPLINSNDNPAPNTGSDPVNSVQVPVVSFPQATNNINTQTPNVNFGAAAQGNFGLPNTNAGTNQAQPTPTAFNLPTNNVNTNAQANPVQTNPMASQVSPTTGPMQTFGNSATSQRSLSPDQRFLNQGVNQRTNQQWNRPQQQPRRPNGRQMFSSFDPNNPVPFQPRQQTGTQFGGNNPMNFNRLGTAGNDQMTFQHNGLASGDIDAVQFGIGPNQQPFRLDMGSQQSSPAVGGMGQTLGQQPFGQQVIGQVGAAPPFGGPPGLPAPSPLVPMGAGLPMGGGIPGGFNGMMQPGMVGDMGMFGAPNPLFGGFGGFGMEQPPPQRGFLSGFFGNLFG